MRHRNKYETHARADDTGHAPPAGGTSTLLQRLLQKIAGPQEPEGGDGRGGTLPPAGRRSGKGAGSVAPYLDEARNSRPGPLE